MWDRRAQGDDREVIVVELAGQRFAIDILVVREIRGWTIATPLPDAPPQVLGMINLRGVALPIVDLAGMLGFESAEPHESSVVVVAEVGGRLAGLVVDAVCEIVSLEASMLQAAPDVAAVTPESFERGFINTDSGLVTLISLDPILAQTRRVDARSARPGSASQD